METHLLGFQSSVKLENDYIFCTSGNIVTTKHYLNSTGVWGASHYNTGFPIHQRDQISASISCQVCSNSAKVMADLLKIQEQETKVEINGAVDKFYWNSFGASANQGGFVSGNFSFIKSYIRNGSTVSYSNPNGKHDFDNNLIPYYKSSCDVSDCVGWNFSVSQTVTFKIVGTSNVYVIFGISNANITATTVSAIVGNKNPIYIDIGGKKLKFEECKFNSITPNVIGTNNFILYDTNYISYKMREGNKK